MADAPACRAGVWRFKSARADSDTRRGPSTPIRATSGSSRVARSACVAAMKHAVSPRPAGRSGHRVWVRRWFDSTGSSWATWPMRGGHVDGNGVGRRRQNRPPIAVAVPSQHTSHTHRRRHNRQWALVPRAVMACRGEARGGTCRTTAHGRVCWVGPVHAGPQDGLASRYHCLRHDSSTGRAPR